MYSYKTILERKNLLIKIYNITGIILFIYLAALGIPDHLTCLLEICMQVRKQQLELGMEQQTVSK